MISAFPKGGEAVFCIRSEELEWALYFFGLNYQAAKYASGVYPLPTESSLEARNFQKLQRIRLNCADSLKGAVS